MEIHKKKKNMRVYPSINLIANHLGGCLESRLARPVQHHLQGPKFEMSFLYTASVSFGNNNVPQVHDDILVSMTLSTCLYTI